MYYNAQNSIKLPMTAFEDSRDKAYFLGIPEGP